MKMKMMRTLKPTGEMTTLMRAVRVTVMQRSDMEVIHLRYYICLISESSSIPRYYDIKRSINLSLNKNNSVNFFIKWHIIIY